MKYFIWAQLATWRFVFCSGAETNRAETNRDETNRTETDRSKTNLIDINRAESNGDEMGLTITYVSPLLDGFFKTNYFGYFVLIITDELWSFIKAFKYY